MKTISILSIGRTLLVLASLVSMPLSAARISHKPFDYPVNNPVNSRNGGVGWHSAWTGANVVRSPSLNFPGVLTTGESLRPIGETVAQHSTILANPSFR